MAYPGMPGFPGSPGSSGPPSPKVDGGKIWETIVIFLAIFSLWPKILYKRVPLFRHPIWDVIMWTMLFLLVVIFVRRIRRLRKATGNEDDDDHIVL